MYGSRLINKNIWLKIFGFVFIKSRRTAKNNFKIGCLICFGVVWKVFACLYEIWWKVDKKSDLLSEVCEIKSSGFWLFSKRVYKVRLYEFTFCKIRKVVKKSDFSVGCTSSEKSDLQCARLSVLGPVCEFKGVLDQCAR